MLGWVGTTMGALRDRHCNFERMPTLSGQMNVLGDMIQTRKERGQEPVKVHWDTAIASLDSCKRKWLNKKQRKQ
jgi:hypothetical protein